MGRSFKGWLRPYMQHIKSEHGSDAFGFISSSKVTNEENYLMQKLARQIYGTNNVDNCSRYCQSPATDGLFKTVGMGGDAGTVKDIAEAGLSHLLSVQTRQRDIQYLQHV